MEGKTVSGTASGQSDHPRQYTALEHKDVPCQLSLERLSAGGRAARPPPVVVAICIIVH